MSEINTFNTMGITHPINNDIKNQIPLSLLDLDNVDSGIWHTHIPYFTACFFLHDTYMPRRMMSSRMA